MVSAKMLKDEKDGMQKEFFKLLPNDKVARIYSFSIPNGKAAIELTANFDFAIKNITMDDKCFQIEIGKIAN